MSTITFDTLKYARSLEKVGVPAEQATVHADALADALNTGLSEAPHKSDLAQLVTRADLKAELANFATKADLRELGLSMTIKMGGMLVVAVGVLLTAMKMMLG